MIIPSTLSSDALKTITEPCTLKSFTKTNTTCECTLLSAYSRRRLSSTGNDFQFTQESQLVKIEFTPLASKQPDPTPSPTPRPTYRPTPIGTVTVEVSQTISGLDATDFNTPQKLKTNGRMIVIAIRRTINNQTDLNIEEDDVRITSIAAAKSLSIIRKLSSSSISVTYQVTAASTQLSLSQLVSLLTSIITTSSSNGVLGSYIISAYNTIAITYTGTYTGTTLTLSNPSVTVIVVYTPSPTASPTEAVVSNKNRSNTTTIIIASIFACLSFLACVGYLVVYRIYHRHFVQKPKMTDPIN
jgi:hypothetical protein